MIPVACLGVGGIVEANVHLPGARLLQSPYFGKEVSPILKGSRYFDADLCLETCLTERFWSVLPKAKQLRPLSLL